MSKFISSKLAYTGSMHHAGFLSNFCHVPCSFFSRSRSKKFILRYEELHKFICNAADMNGLNMLERC